MRVDFPAFRRLVVRCYLDVDHAFALFMWLGEQPGCLGPRDRVRDLWVQVIGHTQLKKPSMDAWAEGLERGGGV